MGARRSGHDIVVVGASAGGVEALIEFARGLSADLPAAVFVVLHLPAGATTALPQILQRVGPLPATHPEDGERTEPGRIYVAPPDVHMLLARGRVSLVNGPTENGHRPAIDPLFRSAAVSYGPRVIGVVLTGILDDGTYGLQAIKDRGGIAIVQDPDEALFPDMPQNAIDSVDVDLVLPLGKIPAAIEGSQRPELEPVPAGAGLEDPPAPGVIESGSEPQEDAMPGEISGFTCPDCGGSLWEIRDGQVSRFRCRVGHGYSPDTLLARQTENVESAFWSAIRALEERRDLALRLAERMRSHGHRQSAMRFDRQARAIKVRAETLRGLLAEGSSIPAAAVGEGEDAAEGGLEQ